MGILFKPFAGIFVNALALFALVRFVPEIAYSGSLSFFLIGGLVLGLLNTFVRPILNIFTGPLIFLTGGLFLIVINMAILWFLQYFIGIIEFQDVALAFPNLGSYVIGAIVFGIINWLLGLIT